MSSSYITPIYTRWFLLFVWDNCKADNYNYDPNNLNNNHKTPINTSHNYIPFNFWPISFFFWFIVFISFILLSTSIETWLKCSLCITQTSHPINNVYLALLTRFKICFAKLYMEHMHKYMCWKLRAHKKGIQNKVSKNGECINFY